MKLLSIIIPSYNAEKYLNDCLSSLLIDENNRIEVIVINDGSKDKTSEIAHRFANEYDFIKVFDKENGGHGSVINKGLEVASGLYFKVLDSDDHLDKDGLKHLLDLIEKHQELGTLPDLYLADYHSVAVDTGKYQTVSLKHRFKEIEKIVTWENVKRFNRNEFVMIHMTYAKTSFLRDSHLHLLEKVFYEDNQYDFHLIRYSKTLCYLDRYIYQYSVGVDGQSISLESVDRNYMHQFNVYKAVIDSINFDEYKVMDKYRRRQIIHEFFILSVVAYFYTYIIPTKEKKLAYKEHLKYFRKVNPKIFKRMRYLTPNVFLWITPPFMRGWVTKKVYESSGKKKGWKS